MKVFYSQSTFATFFLCMPLILICACGGGGSEFYSSNSQPLRLVIHYPDGSVQKNNQPDVTSRSIEDLDTCTIIVEDGTPPMQEIMVDFDINEQKRISVPVGNMRMFTFIGKDMDGQPFCKGEVTADISPDTSSVSISCEFVDEICNDGIDNDFDNLIDCLDPDCETASCSTGNFDMVCSGGQCVLPTPAPTAAPSPTPNPSCPTGNIGPNGQCLPNVPVVTPGECEGQECFDPCQEYCRSYLTTSEIVQLPCECKNLDE